MRLPSPASLLLVSALLSTPSLAQQEATRLPPAYRGVRSIVSGVFVTPIPNAPFSGTVEVLSKEPLDDGTIVTRHTQDHIARNSAGVIYNERRAMVPASFKGEPPLLSAHIYDPRTRLSTFYQPATHLATESVLSGPLHEPAALASLGGRRDLGAKEEDLGLETVAGLALHGVRTSHPVVSAVSGAQHEIVVTDEYWYSDDLNMYVIVKHNDPRSGEQLIAITEADRSEPDPARFAVPAGYKVVDETPPEPAGPAARPAAGPAGTQP